RIGGGARPGDGDRKRVAGIHLRTAVAAGQEEGGGDRHLPGGRQAVPGALAGASGEGACGGRRRRLRCGDEGAGGGARGRSGDAEAPLEWLKKRIESKEDINS